MRFLLVLASLSSLASATLHGQSDTLGILRHTPGDAASPGNIVTVTFDRPVAGRLDATIDASRLLRIEPAVKGRTEWRDPITMRFVPDAPLTPGAEFTVTVDTGFRAIDGTRLARPFRFAFRVPGPRLLARSFGGDGRVPGRLPVDGRIRLLYSAPVDLDAMRRTMRLELEKCGGHEVALAIRIVRQRPVESGDPYQFQYAGGWDRDTTGDRFRRVVEIDAQVPLPEDCGGHLVIATTEDDARHGDMERWPVRTPLPFRVARPYCGSRCPIDHVVLDFTAAVKRDDLLRSLRLTPATPFTLRGDAEVATQWVVNVSLAPRSRYTIGLDTTLRDVDGRILRPPHSVEIITGDYTPALGYATGAFTMPRSGAGTIPLRHVNVRTVTVWSWPVPDSLRVLALTSSWYDFRGIMSRIRTRPDSLTVTLEGTLNEERISELPLPASARRGLAFILIERRSLIQSPPQTSPPQSSPGTLQSVRALPPFVTVASGDEQRMYELVQPTDLSVHAKAGLDETTVLVTGLTDGRPRAGATVRQLDSTGAVIAQGKTDSLGVVRLRTAALPRHDQRLVGGRIVYPARAHASAVEVTSGADRALVPVWPGYRVGGISNPIAPWTVGANFNLPSGAAATIFTDRGIYRPGEMLYLKAIVREGDLGDLRTPSDRRVRLLLTHRPDRWDSDDDVVVRDTILMTNEFGTVTDSVRLPLHLTLGDYEAELRVADGNDWEAVANESIRVAEYRAPEFLVETKSDSAPRFGGDTLVVQASARYLFGSPMSRGTVRWGALLHETGPWDIRIPGAEGWRVGEWRWWGNDAGGAPTSIGGSATLDSAGRLQLHVPIAQLRPTRPGRLTVEVAVTDINRQTVSSSVSVPVHPAHLYVLARRQSREWLWSVGKAENVQVRAVRPDGRDIAGVPVIVTVMRLTWSWDGRTSRMDSAIVRTDTVRTGDAPASFTLTPTRGGIYEIRLTASDGRGGTARTTLVGYAIADGGFWARSSPYHLPLVAGTRDAAVGDVVDVSFDSPFDSAEAWVTIERERVIEQRLVRVRRGANVIPVRVTSAHIPNVFASVLLLRRSGDRRPPDAASDVMRLGYTELRVSTEPKRLRVSVAPGSSEYRPGDTAVVNVRVSDQAGRGVRGEITLWAVDEGVLALTGYETPDLVGRLHAPRSLGSQLWSTMPTLLTAKPPFVLRLMDMRLRGSASQLSSVVVTGMEAPGLAMTGESMRSQFRSTAFYLGSARTATDGRVAVSARLPDNLTTYRLMAVAIGADDRFGHADTAMLVTRDIVARPSLPRFVRPGDSLVAGAVVNARDGGVRPVSVEAQAEGIRLQGSPRTTVTLAEGKGAEARFAFGVPPRDSAPDSVVVRLRASDGVHGDAVETRLPVRPDFHRRTHTQLGALRDASELVMDLPAAIDPERSHLRLRVGTSPLVPMLAAWERLRVYPYDCTEQLVSGGRALIAVWRATARDTTALGGDPGNRLQEVVDQISRRQRRDGAIRYWPGHGWSSLWLTAYAGQFLLEAREQGALVDSVVIRRLTGFVTGVLDSAADTTARNRDERREIRLELGGRTAAVEYLRRAGIPREQAEDELLRLAPAMTWEDRLRLAELLALRSDRRSAARALVDAAWRAVKPAGRRVDLPDSAHAVRAFPSRIAPAARLLSASLAIRSEHPLLGGLMETVLQHGRAESRWAWSTQDYASVVMALAGMTDKESGRRSVRVTARGRTLFARDLAASDSSPDIPLTGLLERNRDGRVRLRLRLTTERGAMPLYYSISVDEIPNEAPVTPDIAGIVVERWYERFDDGRPVTSVKEGDLVRVRLRVTVPSDRHFVAVEDPLPAGLEPIDLRLRTSGSLQPFVTPTSERARAQGDRDRDGPRWQAWLYGSWDDGWWSPWEHKAIHDDRVVYFSRMLWTGSYTASYVARATVSGTFVRPPAHAEEMYNPALQGRSDGGRFDVTASKP